MGDFEFWFLFLKFMFFPLVILDLKFQIVIFSVCPDIYIPKYLYIDIPNA